MSMPVFIRSTSSGSGNSRVSGLPSYALKRVLERIERSFQSEIRLASLAEETGYRRGHFLKMFRMSTGMTPHRYVLQRRVERARSLLKRRGMKIIDIAAECGFSSQAHLTQVFREYVGITPAEYRRYLVTQSCKNAPFL